VKTSGSDNQGTRPLQPQLARYSEGRPRSRLLSEVASMEVVTFSPSMPMSLSKEFNRGGPLQVARTG
jgi:hypothetical protein